MILSELEFSQVASSHAPQRRATVLEGLHGACPKFQAFHLAGCMLQLAPGLVLLAFKGGRLPGKRFSVCTPWGVRAKGHSPNMATEEAYFSHCDEGLYRVSSSFV